jgi:hypothetical protein
MRIFLKVVTPECFYRGSNLLTMTLSSLSKGSGVQSWFEFAHDDGFLPAVSPVERIQAFGNDRLLEVWR